MSLVVRPDEDEPTSPSRAASLRRLPSAWALTSPRAKLQQARDASLKGGERAIAPLGGEALKAATAWDFFRGSGGGGGADDGEIRPLLRPAVREERAKAAGLCGGLTPRLRTCLAFSCAFMLVVVVIMVIVGYKVLAPAYVQSRIKATTLTVTQLRIMAPPISSSSSSSSSARALVGVDAAEGAAPAALGFQLAIEGTLSGLSPVGGTLNAFEATLTYAGTTVGTFTMPALTAAANVANPIAVLTQVAAREPAFTAFAQAVLLAASVEVTLSGTVSVTTVVAGSPITVAGVAFSKSVALAGCAGLQGGVVSSFSLTNSTPYAAYADIAVTLPNPSVVGIAPLGDFGAEVYYQGVLVGNVTARNATLLPGPAALSTIYFSGPLAAVAPADLPVIGRLISAYLTSGSPPSLLTASPRACAPAEDCTGAVPLFAPLLSSGAVTLAAALPPSATPLITGVLVRGMFLQPQGARTVGLLLDAEVQVDALLGANSPLRLTSIAIECALQGTTSSAGGSGGMRALGLVSVPLTNTSAPAVVLPRRAGAARDTLGVNVSLPATLDITESDEAFSAFVTYFLSASSVQLALMRSALGASGVTVGLSSVLGNLTVTVPINVTTVVAGIGGFKGVEVEGFSVLDDGQSPPGTVGIAIDVRLLNPSPATFPLGANSTLQVVYQGQPLGLVAIYNATLAPGNNSVRAVGYLAPPPAALPAASTLMSDYLAGRGVTANVSGVDVSLGPGGPTPGWLVKAVQSLTLAATLPGLDPAVSAALLANVSLPVLNLDLYNATSGRYYDRPLASGTVCALLQLPFKLPVSEIARVNVSAGLSYEGSGGAVANISASYQLSTWAPCSSTAECAPLLAACSGAPLARAAAELSAGSARALAAAARRSSAAAQPPPLVSPAGVLSLNLFQTPLDTGARGPGGLSGLVARVLRGDFVTVRLSGTASPSIVGLPFGSIALAGIPLDTEIVLRGMSNLTNPPASVTNGQIYDTFAGGLNVTVDLNVTNPSSLTGSLGPTAFGIAYPADSPQWDFKGGLPAILVALANLQVAPGAQRFTVPATFFLPPEATSPFAAASVRQLLGRFLSQLSTNVTLEGLGPSNNNVGMVSSGSDILQPAIETLRAGCTFPGVPEPLLTNATLIPDITTILSPPVKANATLRLTNVLNVTLTIKQASLTLYQCADEETTAGGNVCVDDFYDDALGFFYNGDLTRDFGGVVAPPLSSEDTPQYPVTFLGSSDDVSKAVQQAIADKGVVTKANGTALVALVGPSGTGIEVLVALEQLDLPVCLFDSKDCDVRRPQRPAR